MTMLSDSPEEMVVLYVDSDTGIQEQIAASLDRQANGITVRQKSTPSDALEVLETDQSIDCLVSDIQFPGSSDGVEFLQSVRERYSGLPIIVYTATSAGEELANLLEVVTDLKWTSSKEPSRDAFDLENLISKAVVQSGQMESIPWNEQTMHLAQQNQHLEEFADVISHNLKNLISLVNSNIGDLTPDTVAEEQAVAGVLESTDRMENLIENLLELSKKGQYVNEPEEVSLQEIARDAWELLDSGHGQCVVDDDMAFWADPPRLFELFQNLYDNALKHNEPPVSIRVGVLLGHRGFYVEDDGGGIPEEIRNDVFYPGYSTSEDGTGWGLAIVQKIAFGHGWFVTITESESGGARFEFNKIRPTSFTAVQSPQTNK